eukprot:gb/GECH01011592.1/.p1 GENE.gb/GECH01011592.1/~~gb/GECH01011592.1/.p1  ORF type:complete len:132 (+),score=19.09 gb/GECH01011592.1/:1-396(+)
MATSPQRAELYKGNTTFLNYALSPKQNSLGIFMAKEEAKKMKSSPADLMADTEVFPVRRITQGEFEELKKKVADQESTISSLETELQEQKDHFQRLMDQQRQEMNRIKDKLYQNIGDITPRGGSMTRDDFN